MLTQNAQLDTIMQPAKQSSTLVPSEPTSDYPRLPGSPLVSSSSPVRSQRHDARSSSVFLFSSPPTSSRSQSRLSSALPSSPPPLSSTGSLAWPAPTAGCLPEAPTSIATSRVTIQPGQTIHFGRKLKNITQSATVRRFDLPKSAKHASRHHCAVHLEAAGEALTLVITVTGQNGMLLDGEKVPIGTQRVALSFERLDLILGFYSDYEVQLLVNYPQERRKVLHQRLAVPSSPGRSDTLASEATSALDLNSSPPAARAVNKAAAPSIVTTKREPLRPVKKQKQSHTTGTIARPAHSVKKAAKSVHPTSLPAEQSQEEAAPSSDKISPYAHQADDGYPPEDSSSSSASEDENGSSAEVRAAEKEAGLMRIKAAISELSLDLAGALASALVFQPRATLTTSECTALLLDNQPSLLAYGQLAAWRPFVLRTLRTGPFGAIEDTRGLKDAAGKKLEPSWHYSPNLDKDAVRRSSLQPFVKTVRAAQRERKQYFYKRPSDLKKRSRW